MKTDSAPATPASQPTPQPDNQPGSDGPAPEPAAESTGAQAKPSIAERLEAAKAKHLPDPAPKGDASAMAAVDPKAGASTSSSTEAASSPDAKPTEDKKPDERAARRAAAIAERDAHVTAEATRVKAERAAFESERTAHNAEVAHLREVAKAAKENPLRMLELLGVDLEALNNHYLSTLREQTPEERAKAHTDAARKAAREEYEAIQAAEAEKATKAQQERAAAETTAYQTAVAGYQDDLEKLVAAAPAKYRRVLAAYETASDIWARAEKHALRENGGKVLPPGELLDLLEKRLRVDDEKPAAAKPEDKKPRQARDTRPNTVTSRSTGEVPVRSVPTKPHTRADRQARLAEAKARHGVNN